MRPFLTVHGLGLAALPALVSGGFGPCPNLCSGHGNCHDSRVCECFAGFTGADCSLLTCPQGPAWTDEVSAITGVDQAHNIAECSNRGTCDRATGVCICEDSRFEGAACERRTCPDVCNGRGRCQSMKYFATLKDKGAGTVFEYSTIWDANMMFGCNCDPGFFGPDCSLRSCPTGDDPLTGTVLDPTGTQVGEWQNLECSANSGYVVLSFRGYFTQHIPFDASESELQAALEALPSISNEYGPGVSVSNSGQDMCQYAKTTTQIRFLQNFGDLPLLVADGSNLGLSVGTAGPTIAVREIQAGTKENDVCANRGLCDETVGVCQCMLYMGTSDGYGNPGQRGDCGAVSQPLSDCHEADSPCNLHGTCRGFPTFRCRCQRGWTGADCSERTCPFGRSWFGIPTANNVAHSSAAFVECSNMGTCNRATGTCECVDGFEGSACNVMACPGDPQCSDHGQCLNMAQLAARATRNGDETAYTYGATPNKAATWDADMMQGCACDAGHEGYDCSLLSCATGDDPQTINQDNEVQVFSCTHDGTPATATVALRFRERQTAALPYTTTLAALEAALEGLTTITALRLTSTLAATDPICDAIGTPIYIEFLSPTGDVPNIRFTLTDMDAATLTEDTPGTKEDIVCSGRGMCDHETGVCTCFPGFGSSDGQNGKGVLDDCGYKVPIYKCPDGTIDC